MCTAADNCQESICSVKDIRAELDGEVAGAGEGAGDGGAEVGTFSIETSTIIIKTSITVIIPIIRVIIWHQQRAAVALGGGSVIDLHPVIASTSRISHSVQTVEVEGDCLSIG